MRSHASILKMNGGRSVDAAAERKAVMSED